jgi:hypothetical protein
MPPADHDELGGAVQAGTGEEVEHSVPRYRRVPQASPGGFGLWTDEPSGSWQQRRANEAAIASPGLMSVRVKPRVPHATAARNDISGLKRQVRALEGDLKRLRRDTAGTPARSPQEESSNLRFRADGVKSHRERLGLSAKDYGRRVGPVDLQVGKRPEPTQAQVPGGHRRGTRAGQARSERTAASAPRFQELSKRFGH